MRQARILALGLCVAAASWLPSRAGQMSQTTIPAPLKPPAVATGKERLSGKAADEQRVDDCKVPPDKRGSKQRPAECGSVRNE
ncbi:MAG TPA: hypothetical protein VHG30_11890 [Microvirga sp.]|nr:hypothetical protein [Microvirga sp.]